MSYPEQARPKKPTYFTTLPERIAQSPTGIAKIPNSRFPTIAPLNSSTFKSAYERAGFDVYKPPAGQRSAPQTPRVPSGGYRSASASHLPSSNRSTGALNLGQKRNASEYFQKSQGSPTHSQAPPLPHLKIDAQLANDAAKTGGNLHSRDSPLEPKTAATMPLARSQPSPSPTASTRVPQSATAAGYAFNASERLPPIGAASKTTMGGSSADVISNRNYQSARSSGTSQTTGPQSSRSSGFESSSQRNNGPQSTTSQVFDRNVPQSATSSGFGSQRDLPQSTTSSKFDLHSTSTGSSGNSGPGSVYMSTQSFPLMGSRSNLRNGSSTSINTVQTGRQLSGTTPSVAGNPVFTPQPSRPGYSSSLNQSFDTVNEVQSINSTSTAGTPVTTAFSSGNSATGGVKEQLKSDAGESKLNTRFQYPPLPSPSEKPQADKSMGGDYSFDHTNQSTGTVKYQPDGPQAVSNIKDLSDDSSDDELNLSSDDELNLSSDEDSDDESMKSAILSPNPQSRKSDAPTPLQIAQLQKDAAQLATPTPPLPPQHTAIPLFTVSDPEGNITQHRNPLSPTAVAKSLASPGSVYSEGFSPEQASPRQSPVTSNSYDEGTADVDEVELEESNTNVFEEVENQLENLTMNSSANQSKHSFDFTNDKSHLYQEPAPLQIQKHSVKESSTDTESQRSIGQYSQKSTPHLHDQDQFQGSVPPETPHSHVSITSSDHVSPLHVRSKAKWPPGEGPCRKCDLEISNKPIYSKSGELSGQWHRPCFTCTMCDIRFNKNISCFVLNDEPYCEDHYHLTNNSLCRVCGRGIVGKCLENDAEDRYHADCLKCTLCSVQITSDYLSINGKVHCEPCGMEYRRKSTHAALDKIERRRTRLFFI